MFQKVLVFEIFLFEEDFSGLKIQFVPVLAGDVINVVKDLLDGGLLDSAFLLSIFDFKVKSVDFEFAHVFAERFFEDCKGFLGLTEVIKGSS